MTVAISSTNIVPAGHIPYVTADEAYALMHTAFDRFIRLIESLQPDDWSKPTACTAWDVHDMVAHQAGGYASGTSYREMFRQYSKLPKKGQLPEDAINELQVGQRRSMSPADLVSELKHVGDNAIHNWAYGFRAISWIAVPHPVAGLMSLRHLNWIIHSRDTWIHRLDICRATNRPFEQTREHDGRINELVVMDLARSLKRKLGKRGFNLILTGIAGGTWKIGEGAPEAEIEMDTLDFNIHASGRFSYEEALSRANLSGNQALAELAFKNFMVLY